MKKIVSFIKDFFEDIFSYPEISNEEVNRYHTEGEIDPEKTQEIRMKRIKLVVFLITIFWVLYFVVKK